MGSALALLPSARNTQLDDFSQYKYNEKYGAWMPGDADPDKWAAENLAAPPPPPKSSSTTTDSNQSSASLSCEQTAKQHLQRDQLSNSSAPQTPLPVTMDGRLLPPTPVLQLSYQLL